MLTTLALLVVAWAIMVPAVLALARVLGRLSALKAHDDEAPAATAPHDGAADNVVALVPHPQNRLDSGSRRAA